MKIVIQRGRIADWCCAQYLAAAGRERTGNIYSSFEPETYEYEIYFTRRSCKNVKLKFTLE
jgi:hypothetical protein